MHSGNRTRTPYTYVRLCVRGIRTNIFSGCTITVNKTRRTAHWVPLIGYSQTPQSNIYYIYIYMNVQVPHAPLIYLSGEQMCRRIAGVSRCVCARYCSCAPNIECISAEIIILCGLYHLCEAWRYNKSSCWKCSEIDSTLSFFVWVRANTHTAAAHTIE